MPGLASPRASAHPPAPPAWIDKGGGGGGGEPFRVPWWLWLVASGVAGSWLILAYELVLATPGRPFPILAGLTGAVLSAWIYRRPDEPPTARVQGLVYLGGIIGGVLGEFAHSVLIGAPPTVANHLGWIVAGAGGIGGAVGVGMSMFVTIGWAIATLLLILWRDWRRRRAA